MRTVGVGFIGILLGAVPLAAQVRADPGVVIGSKIAVRVNATLTDEETPYSPVRGLVLAFTRPSADTVIGRTDEAGVVTVLLPPGNYTVSTRQPYAWKGTWYTWTVPITVRADMSSIELSRANAKVGAGALPTRTAVNRSLQSSGEVSSPPARTSRVSDTRAIPWLSMEVGGEGGLTKFGDETGSDAGYGGSGSFVGGLGPVALAVGHRYTRIRYGNDIDPGNVRGGTLELRYHFRPGSAPVRPYVGGVAGVGRWHDSDSLTDDTYDMRMFGGTVGVQFGLATSVRLHVSATAAGTHVNNDFRPPNNGFFTAANLGLTFDIFSPAR